MKSEKKTNDKMEKEETPSPPLSSTMTKNDSSTNSDFSCPSSHGSSDKNDFPSNPSSWSNGLIDKFGIRREIPYDETKPYKQWVQEWFPKTTVKELKLFSENCEEFGYFLFDTMQQIHQPEKRESQLPYEIDYQILFEKFLKLFEFKVMTQSYLPMGHATIFGQEISSKADILVTKCDDPRIILSVCEVKRKNPEEGTDFSPVKKKSCSSSSTLETVNEETSSSTSSIGGLSSNVYAQHVGELLAYLESSVLKRGLLGMVIQKTNVLFTFLKIKPESFEKIKRRNKPGSVKFDSTKDEEPILFYTKQLNFLKSEDRKIIFKALITMRIMEVKDWDY
ncbi:uncharacterized protein LOC133205250 isoform X2 [Saccostrea echinata]|uniref:uncharacterized protein LOC133205250 isoform X2 n=1 Tax=Saccostrea echinata TaxID=191078 RepID=UPI002A83EE9E|nr:uncharacterized protein LOC133205250 isoform X2 [Saccostrea echinata]